LVETSFGKWLKNHRRSSGLTQQQLSKQIGCSTITLRKIEAEERRPSTQIVERLADIFNISNDEQAAFVAFARSGWKSAPEKQSNRGPWKISANSVRTNLPAAITSLIGRARDMELVQQYLLKDEIRLVTLMGPPGIGKTRLAIETAHKVLSNFPDGVFFAPLAPLTNSLLIASTVVQSLGFADKKHRSAFEMLRDGIGDKHMLLLLDNCEHLIEAAATLVSDLLSACPRLTILATSRESLRIPGEWLYTVPTLELPGENSPIDVETARNFPALLLFAERAHAVNPDFTLNPENIQAVVSICLQLDGLPLAIELIASRMRMMSPQAMLKHMNSQFVLSANGMRAISARQKTLKNAIHWSYDLLSNEDQRLFACLSVFSGGFTMGAAESIFAGMVTARTVMEIVTSLSDKSLLLRAMDEGGDLRYYMLFTIQQFAHEHFDQLPEAIDVRKSHLDYFLKMAVRANREIHGPNQIRWLALLDQEYDNFRSALEWSFSQKDTRSALKMVSSLSWYWGLWRHNSELRNWFERLQELGHLRDHPLLYGQLLNHMGNSNWVAGDFQNARVCLEEALALWKQLGKSGHMGMAQALCLMGMVSHSIDSDYETSQSLFEQSLALYEECGSQWGMALASFNLGWVHDHTDHDQIAQEYLERSLQLFSELGDSWGMGRSSQFLGQLFLKQGRYNLAERYFKQHLSIDEQLQFKPGTVVALGNLGDLYRFQEEYEEAEHYLLRSLAVCREYGIKIDRGYYNYALGMLGLQKQDYAFATKYIKQYFESGSPVSQALATSDLCLGLAAAAAGLAKPERAARLHGAAQKLLQVIDIPYTPFDRDIFDRHIQLARKQLGDENFKILEKEGRSMTMEQAIALALQE
jgi:predicted ATPase/DNA-binding XRE family transcriptional regulator